jgi:hypothetical protein
MFISLLVPKSNDVDVGIRRRVLRHVEVIGSGGEVNDGVGENVFHWKCTFRQ